MPARVCPTCEVASVHERCWVCSGPTIIFLEKPNPFTSGASMHHYQPGRKNYTVGGAIFEIPDPEPDNLLAQEVPPRRANDRGRGDDR